MCLESKRQRPMVATGDMTCYKLLGKISEGWYFTPFMTTHVSLGKAIEAKHPYDLPIKGLNHGYMISGEGVHAYTSKKEAISSALNLWNVAEAIIPEGTAYWLSTNGKEIAARRMIINRIIK